MKKLFLGSVALVALGLAAPAAFAAERPVPYTPPPPPVPVYTWTGCYVGASAGTSYGTSTHSTVGNSVFTSNVAGPTPLPAAVAAGSNIADSFNLSGFIGGRQNGCNYQARVGGIGFEAHGPRAQQKSQAQGGPHPPFLLGKHNQLSPDPHP